MVKRQINQFEIQRSGIIEEGTNIKANRNLLTTNIPSLKQLKENLMKKNLQLRNEIKQIGKTWLL